MVDVAVEEFLDRVSRDALMGKLASRTVRKRMQGLTRRYLEAGIMADDR